MKRFSLILLILTASSLLRAGDLPDNVRVTDEEICYEILSRQGEPYQVKVDKKQTYEALRSDDEAIASTFYNDNVTIDKAKAPYAVAVYRQWLDSDIFYDDYRICALPLKLTKGKPVKAEFKSTMTRPEYFSEIAMGRGDLTLKSTVRVIVPADLAGRITLEPRRFADNMSMTSTVDDKGNVTYTIAATDIEPMKRERYGESAIVAQPSVMVKGMFANVGELYGFYRKYLPDYEEENAEVAALARKICGSAPDDYARIDSLASWVRHNIRYVAIEHGDYGISPAAPADVLAKRYGDCKGSASLLKAMMKAVSIDGRLAWIGTRGHSDQTWDSHPATGTGNHMIAVALVGDSIVYIDGTAIYAPDGHIPAAIRGQQAMIENGDGYILATVPASPVKSAYEVAGSAYLSDKGLSGNMTHRFTGDYRSLMGNLIGSVATDRRDKMLNYIFSNKRKTVETANETYCADSVSAMFAEKDAVRKIGGKTYVQLSPVRTLFYEPVTTDKPRRDLCFDHLENTGTTVSLTIPEDMTVKSLPKLFAVDDEWFSAEIAYSQSGNTILCRSAVKMKADRVPVDRIDDWNNSFKSILKASDARIVLE